MTTPDDKPISYHIPEKYRHLLDVKWKVESVSYDGHTPADVLKRLEDYCI